MGTETDQAGANAIESQSLCARAAASAAVCQFGDRRVARASAFRIEFDAASIGNAQTSQCAATADHPTHHK